MINTNANPAVLIESDPAVIQAELARLLGERRFSGAPQMSAFLRYIVQETLDGNADRIKAFSVGVDALGKPDTFDAQSDPSVRVLALRLRKTLAAIYEDPRDSLAIIELKVGTYVPTFYKPTGTVASAEPKLTEPVVDDVVTPITRPPASDKRRSNTGLLTTVQQDFPALVANDVQPKMGQDSDVPVRSVPVDARSSMGDVAQRAVGGKPIDSGSTLKWLYAAAAILLIAGWQIAVQNADVQAGTHTEPRNALNAVSTAQLASADGNIIEPGKRVRDRPTIVVHNAADGLELERKIMLMLASNFVQSGTLSVVKVSGSTASSRKKLPGEYQLVLNAYSVDEERRVDTQIMSLSDGEMLFAQTLVLTQSGYRFSAKDLGVIENLALGIASPDGPLYADFCKMLGADPVPVCTAG